MDRNAIIALFLYRRRKRRRNRLRWVHAIIQEREKFDALCTLFDELRDEENNFFNYFRMSVSSLDELRRPLKENLERRNIKMRNYTQPVEMLAVAIR
jgi:hypothetical protein